MSTIPRDHTRNRNWNVGGSHTPAGIFVDSIEDKHTALLLDIRDELQRLNALLHCQNFVGIPAELRAIRAKLPAKKRKPRK